MFPVSPNRTLLTPSGTYCGMIKLVTIGYMLLPPFMTPVAAGAQPRKGTPNFELVADILDWLLHRFEPGIAIPDDISSWENDQCPGIQVLPQRLVKLCGSWVSLIIFRKVYVNATAIMEVWQGQLAHNGWFVCMLRNSVDGDIIGHLHATVLLGMILCANY